VNVAPRTLQWVGGLSIFRCQVQAFLDEILSWIVPGRDNKTWVVEVVLGLNEQPLINPTSQYFQVKAAE